MVDLAEDGMTMIVVTHEMGFARKGRRSDGVHGRRRDRRTGTPEQFFTSSQVGALQKFLSQILQH